MLWHRKNNTFQHTPSQTQIRDDDAIAERVLEDAEGTISERARMGPWYHLGVRECLSRLFGLFDLVRASCYIKCAIGPVLVLYVSFFMGVESFNHHLTIP